MRSSVCLLVAAALSSCAPDDGPCRGDFDCNGVGLVCDVSTGFCQSATQPPDRPAGGGGGWVPANSGGSGQTSSMGGGGAVAGGASGGGAVGAGGGSGSGSAGGGGLVQPPAPGGVSPAPRNALGLPTYSEGRAGLAVDAAGVTHLLAILNPAAPTLSYGRCATNCLSPSSWSWVGLLSTTDGDVTLAVDEFGVLSAAVTHHEYNANKLEYWRCGGSCLSAASWQGSTILQQPRIQTGRGSFFSVVRGGGARVAFWGYRELVVGRCASNCASPSNWTYVAIAIDSGFTDLDLDVSANGTTRVVTLAELDRAAFYAECSTNCDVAAQWSVLSMPNPDFGESIAVGSSPTGGARVSYFQRVGNGPRTLKMLVCSGNCSAAASWSGWSFASSDGANAVDIQFDSGGRPLVILSSSADTKVLRCVADCGAGGDWTEDVIDSGDEMMRQFPLPGPQCHAGEMLRCGPVDERSRLSRNA